MIKVFLGIVVVALIFAAVSFWQTKDTFSGKAPAKPGPETEAKDEVGKRKLDGAPDVKVDLQRTVTDIPVLASDTERFEKGDLIKAGRVVDVQKGVALVKASEGPDVLLVTSQQVPTHETVMPSGYVWNEDGTLDAVMVARGRALRVGRATSQGVVEALLSDRAVVRRRDGGVHYVIFGEHRAPEALAAPTPAAVAQGPLSTLPLP